MRSKARQKSARKYFGQFLAKVITDATRGEIKRNFIFLQTYAIIAEPILDRRPRKKHSIAPEQLIRQYVTRFKLTSTV